MMLSSVLRRRLDSGCLNVRIRERVIRNTNGTLRYMAVIKIAVRIINSW